MHVLTARIHILDYFNQFGTDPEILVQLKSKRIPINRERIIAAIKKIGRDAWLTELNEIVQYLRPWDAYISTRGTRGTQAGDGPDKWERELASGRSNSGAGNNQHPNEREVWRTTWDGARRFMKIIPVCPCESFQAPLDCRAGISDHRANEVQGRHAGHRSNELTGYY